MQSDLTLVCQEPGTATLVREQRMEYTNQYSVFLLPRKQSALTSTESTMICKRCTAGFRLLSFA